MKRAIRQRRRLLFGVVLATGSLATTLSTNVSGAQVDVEDCPAYVVDTDDTLYRIGQRNNVTVANIMDWSDLSTTLISVGQVVCVGQPYTSANQPIATPQNITLQECVMHVVSKGETLNKIAERYGTTVAVIVAANDLADENAIKIDQSLCIPRIPTPTNTPKAPHSVDVTTAVPEDARQPWCGLLYEGTHRFNPGERTIMYRVCPGDGMLAVMNALQFPGTVEDFIRTQTLDQGIVQGMFFNVRLDEQYLRYYGPDFHTEYPWKPVNNPANLKPLSGAPSGIKDNDASLLHLLAFGEGVDGSLTEEEAAKVALGYAIRYNESVKFDLESIGIHPYDLVEINNFDELINQMVDAGYDLREMLNTLDWAIRDFHGYEYYIQGNQTMPVEFKELIEQRWQEMGFEGNFPDLKKAIGIWRSYMYELDPNAAEYTPELEQTFESQYADYLRDLRARFGTAYLPDWGESYEPTEEDDALFDDRWKTQAPPEESAINQPCATADPDIIAVCNPDGDIIAIPGCSSLTIDTCAGKQPANNGPCKIGSDESKPAATTCAAIDDSLPTCGSQPQGTITTCKPPKTWEESHICSSSLQSHVIQMCGTNPDPPPVVIFSTAESLAKLETLQQLQQPPLFEATTS